MNNNHNTINDIIKDTNLDPRQTLSKQKEEWIEKTDAFFDNVTSIVADLETDIKGLKKDNIDFKKDIEDLKEDNQQTKIQLDHLVNVSENDKREKRLMIMVADLSKDIYENIEAKAKKLQGFNRFGSALNNAMNSTVRHFDEKFSWNKPHMVQYLLTFPSYQKFFELLKSDYEMDPKDWGDIKEIADERNEISHIWESLKTNEQKRKWLTARSEDLLKFENPIPDCPSKLKNPGIKNLLDSRVSRSEYEANTNA